MMCVGEVVRECSIYICHFFCPIRLPRRNDHLERSAPSTEELKGSGRRYLPTERLHATDHIGGSIDEHGWVLAHVFWIAGNRAGLAGFIEADVRDRGFGERTREVKGIHAENSFESAHRDGFEGFLRGEERMTRRQDCTR